MLLPGAKPEIALSKAEVNAAAQHQAAAPCWVKSIAVPAETPTVLARDQLAAGADIVCGEGGDAG